MIALFFLSLLFCLDCPKGLEYMYRAKSLVELTGAWSCCLQEHVFEDRLTGYWSVLTSYFFHCAWFGGDIHRSHKWRIWPFGK